MSPISHRAALLPLLAAIVVFLAADAFVFGARGTYWRLAEPQSYAGKVSTLVQVEETRASDPLRDVLVVGDSRIRMGVDPDIASLHTGVDSLVFHIGAVEGTKPRTWYYLLRRIDPDADRYAAVVVPILEYNDRDVRFTGGPFAAKPANSPSDLRALLPLVQPWDALRVLSAFDGPENRDLALRVLCFKGLAYRDDWIDWWRDPSARRKEVAARIANHRSTRGAAQGLSRSTVALGLELTGSGRGGGKRASVPKQVRERITASYRNAMADSTGIRARYQELWLEAITNHYRGSHTRVLLLPLPRAPLIRDEDRPAPHSGTPLALAQQGALRLLAEAPVRELEAPRFFADHVHLNLTGRKRYSEYLGAEVSRLLSGENVED